MNLIQRLKGRFLTIDKLNALLEANDLSIGALIDGATAKIVLLRSAVGENQRKAADYNNLADKHNTMAEEDQASIDNIQAALDVLNAKAGQDA